MIATEAKTKQKAKNGACLERKGHRLEKHWAEISKLCLLKFLLKKISMIIIVIITITTIAKKIRWKLWLFNIA